MLGGFHCHSAVAHENPALLKEISDGFVIFEMGWDCAEPHGSREWVAIPNELLVGGVRDDTGQIWVYRTR